jgi:hypothetical protein
MNTAIKVKTGFNKLIGSCTPLLWNKGLKSSGRGLDYRQKTHNNFKQTKKDIYLYAKKILRKTFFLDFDFIKLD